MCLHQNISQVFVTQDYGKRKKHPIGIYTLPSSNIYVKKMMCPDTIITLRNYIFIDIYFIVITYNIQLRIVYSTT